MMISLCNFRRDILLKIADVTLETIPFQPFIGSLNFVETCHQIQNEFFPEMVALTQNICYVF